VQFTIKRKKKTCQVKKGSWDRRWKGNMQNPFTKKYFSNGGTNRVQNVKGKEASWKEREYGN